jgi:hypothetical protein
MLRIVFEPDMIDAVVVTPGQDAVLLYIFERDGWNGSDEQLISFQAKVHAYVGFAVDGQLASSYPEAASLPWRIVVESQAGPPDHRSAEVIDRLAGPVRRYGGDIALAG